MAQSTGLIRTVRIVSLLNLAYFGVEFVTALRIGSVSLLADSIDFLEDASVNALIAVALAWPVARRAQVGTVLAGILLIPVGATVWAISRKVVAPVPPAAMPLSLAGIGALMVNLACAVLLARYRTHQGSLTLAAFLSARNDAIANIAIVIAGVMTAYTLSVWPDLIVGIGVALMNLGAAADVYRAAQVEHRAAKRDDVTR